MQWVSKSIILSVKKYGEKSAIITVLTENYGVYSGVVNDINKSNNSLYNIGNIIEAKWQARLEEHLGQIRAELSSSIIGYILTDKLRLTALSSICSLVVCSLVERSPEDELFLEFVLFIDLLKKHNNTHWLKQYVLLELLLLQILGFGLDLTDCAATGVHENLTHLSPKSGRSVCFEAAQPYLGKLFDLPKFFIDREEEVSVEDIMNGLKITGYFLEKHQFTDYNTRMPESRNRLISLLLF